MYPTRLSLTDFLGHEASDIDLTDMRAVVVTGPVGVGKTSIIEAFTWALWGEARGRTQDDVIREGADRASVTVDLLADGVPMTITRTRPRGKTSTLSLSLNGMPWVTREGTAHTLRETEVEIERLLGVTYRSMLAGPIMVQSDTGALMQVEPRARRDLLLSLLVDTGRWEEWQVGAERLRADAEREASVCERLAEVEGVETRLAALVAAHAADTEELAAREANEGAYAVHLTEARSALAKAQQDAVRGEGAIKAYEAARETFVKARTSYQDSEASLLMYAGLVQSWLDREAPEAPEPVADTHELREAVRTALDAERLADIAVREHNMRLRDAEREWGLATGSEVTCPKCGEVFTPGVEPEHERALVAEVERLRSMTDGLAFALTDAIEASRAAHRASKEADNAHAAALDAWKLRTVWERGLDAAKADEAAALRRRDEARPLVEAASAEGRRVKAEWEQYRDVTARLKAAEEEEARARSNHDIMARQVASMRAKVGTDGAQIAMLEAEVEKARVAQTEAITWRARARVAGGLEKAFGPTGVPSMMLDAAIPAIEDAANEVLGRMPGGFRLTLRTQRPTGKQTLVDAIDVVVDPGTGGERDYGLLSGGQRFRVDLALRLGLTRVLSAGRVQMLVVDEGLDRWQDPEGRGAVLDALGAVMDDFRLVVVVSHHPEVVEWVERHGSRIGVSMDDGISRVEVA